MDDLLLATLIKSAPALLPRQLTRPPYPQIETPLTVSMYTPVADPRPPSHTGWDQTYPQDVYDYLQAYL